MNADTEPAPPSDVWLKEADIALPAGLMGFAEVKNLELIHNTEELPFRWLRSVEDRSIAFVVVQPDGLIPEYELELSDEDAAEIGITDPAEALVLNIVTLRNGRAEEATVNLIGPIVVNRETGTGRQVVLRNHQDYSARHALVGVPAE
ncbi:MAG: flagellar assembly protein FliW [Verrucomicrobia bacterium]|nr:MAG: flagellar assembly protein FliW [Verrucomicrobiota bacterium]